MKIAFLSMCVPEDVQLAESCLPSLLNQLRDGDHVFVLINGTYKQSITLEQDFPKRVTVFRLRRNLGIAKGRNFLIAHALQQDVEWLHIFDADLLAPSGYRDQLESDLQSLRHENIGILSPLLLNAHSFSSFFRRDTTCYRIDSTQRILRNLIKSMSVDLESRRALVFHAGVKDWFAHYFSLADAARGYLRDRWLSRNHSFLLKNVNNENWEVDTLPGGTHIFHRSLVTSDQPYAEYFSPYGYEDVEFCIRHRLAGFRNFCLGSAILLHDPRPEAAEPPNPDKVTLRFLTRAKMQGYVVGRHKIRNFTVTSQQAEIARVAEYLTRGKDRAQQTRLRSTLTLRYFLTYALAWVYGRLKKG